MAAEREVNDTMTKHGIVRLRFAAGLALVALLAVGCSSSDETSTSETSSPGASSTTTTTIAPKITQPRQSCAADTLGAAALASFEAPALVDVVCETEFASATLTNGPGGELVVLFRLENGVWVLAGSAAVADAASAAPAGFSTTAIPAWQRLRDARIARGDRPAGGQTPTGESPPSSLRINPDSGAQEVCTEYTPDMVMCEPPTTFPQPTEPPDPDAPPETVKQSGFCKYNYNDPRCVADPGFEP